MSPMNGMIVEYERRIGDMMKNAECVRDMKRAYREFEKICIIAVQCGGITHDTFLALFRIFEMVDPSANYNSLNMIINDIAATTNKSKF